MAAWRVQLFLPVISDHENVRETGRMENGDGAGCWGLGADSPKEQEEEGMSMRCLFTIGGSRE